MKNLEDIDIFETLEYIKRAAPKNVKQWTVHQRKMSQTVKKNSQKSNVDPKA